MNNICFHANTWGFDHYLEQLLTSQGSCAREIFLDTANKMNFRYDFTMGDISCPLISEPFHSYEPES